MHIKLIVIHCIFSTVSPEGSVVISPHDIIINFGDNITLRCAAMGGPNVTFKWEVNREVVGNDSVLNLMAVDATYGDNYYCIVNNSAGTDSTFTTLYVAPYIVTPLDEQILAAVNGSSLDIICDAAGFPYPNVTWVDMFNMEVSNTSLLRFSPTSFGNEGVYRCVASATINGRLLVAMDDTTLISKILFL